MKLKTFLLQLYWLLCAQFGIEPRKTIRSLRGLPRYMRDFFRLRSGDTGRLELVPCLHALEHYGSGRYGDPNDPKCFERGFVHMARLLRKDGVIYLSVPIGIDRVKFNANRVFIRRLL